MGENVVAYKIWFLDPKTIMLPVQHPTNMTTKHWQQMFLSRM